LTDQEWLAEYNRAREHILQVREELLGRKPDDGPMHIGGIGDDTYDETPCELYTRCVVRRRMRVKSKP
jgi:hypothetical protein